jgi:dihydrolipoamide dehydrogenase
VERTGLVVIGGGPGGYAAAFRAADLGLDVTLVDAEARLGGVCLLRGCIPSKALLHVARIVTEAHEAERFGLRFGAPDIDLDRLRAWKDEVMAALSQGVTQLAQRRAVRVLRARARFRDAETVELEGEGVPSVLGFERAILATGSVPVVSGPFRIEDQRVMDSTAALELPEIPGRLLVVGGGYVGLELGTIYAAIGAKVTVVEQTGDLLAGADRDLVAPLEERLGSLFETIDKSTRVVKLESEEVGVRVHLDGPGVESQQLFDRVLVAVGRRPSSEGLGLERAGVETDDKGFVRVDRARRTSERRILAIGDVAGEPKLAHKAAREGKVAAEVASGEPAEFDNRAIPAVVFTDPEVAWCGLTETKAQAQGRHIEIRRFRWSASGRAHTLGRTEGLTKLVFDPETEQVLGMGIVGPGAGELIAEGALAVEMGLVARDVAETIHTHPTLAETVAEAAESLVGQATHLYTGRPSNARTLQTKS